MVRHFQDDPNPPPFIKALAEVRYLATREGWCYQHVQAITVAIDQYTEKALGNREYFLDKPIVLVAEDWRRPLIVQDSGKLSKNAPLAQAGFFVS
ncbi:hypothetical protein [Bradyrhizobium sp. 157]|uniref:hypothetical protein n=1 Tax=Bradyrhizobium sp. 157 TaxID=2782631 RepID=UPI001FFA2134|nr:hypothetical protein [Bradyrhizobium sp. 157]